MKKIKKYIPYGIIAIILLQTLAYKFTAHPESVDLFSQINLFGLGESFGRIGVGILELLVSIGLFIRSLRKISLIGVVALMLGAVYFHFTIIGFMGNHLQLFISAVVALGISIYLLARER